MVKRIVRLDAKSYEIAVEALSMFQPGKTREEEAFAAHEKLVRIGIPKPREERQNPDLTLYRLPAEEEVIELLESERDVLISALDAINWPTFALAKKRRAVELLKNAQAVETT